MDKDVWDILDKNNYTCTGVKVMTDLFGFISSLFKVIGFLPMV